MMETQGLGAGSYPDCPENEIRCYKVKLVVSSVIDSIIYAESEEDAKELALNKEWDDVEDEKREVEEILDIEEVLK